MLKAHDDFLCNKLILQDKMIGLRKIPIPIGGPRKGLTKKQQRLLQLHGRPLPPPLTKAEKLIRVEHDIREALNNIQYHERCMKAYGTELAILTQKQKTLETTR